MKIRLLSLYAGPLGVLQPDVEVEWDDNEAAALIKAGYAVDVNAPAPVENASGEQDSETASISTKSKKAK